ATGQPDGRVLDGDGGEATDEIIESLEAERFRAQPATRAACLIASAALLGAIAEDGLQAGPVKPGDIELAQSRPDARRMTAGHQWGAAEFDSGNPRSARAAHDPLPLTRAGAQLRPPPCRCVAL